MANIKYLHVLMSAKAADLQSSIQKVEAGLTKLRDNTTGLRSSFASILGGANPFDQLKGGVKNLIGAIPGIGPALQTGLTVVEGFFNKIRQTQKEIGAIGKEAKSVGASVEGYSAMRYMASNEEAMSRSLFKLGDSIAEAALNGGQVDEAFKRIGLSASQLSTMKTDEAFIKVAGALSKIDNSAMKSKTAMDIFGRGAVEIMSEINKGEAGLRKGMAIAKSHGAVISESDLAAVKQANIAMKQWDATIDGVWKRLAVQLAPAVKMFANDMKMLSGGMDTADAAGSGVGAALIQWKYMAMDVWELMKGNLSGPSALERARDATAKFKAEVEQAAAAEKKNQEAIEATNKALKERDELARYEEQMMKRTTAVIDGSMGPWDAFQKKLLEVNTVMAYGKMTSDQYAMSLDKLVSEFERFDAKKTETKNTPMLEFGSTADISYGIKLQQDMNAAKNTNENRTARILEQIRDKQRDMAADAKATREALQKLGLAK